MIKELLNNSFIFVDDHGLSDQLCDDIVKNFEADTILQKPGNTLGGHYPEIKKTLDLGIDGSMQRWTEIDKLIYDSLHNLLEDLVKKLPVLGEIKQSDSGYNVQKYEKNKGRYIYHMDEGGGSSRGRELSVIMYLNNVEKGGETEFKHFGIKVKPNKGRVVVFPPFWMYLHRGCMPISNDKYIISTFIEGNTGQK